MKKVLIVNSSPREEGNCTTFSVHLKKKLDDSTIPCKLINLKDYHIEFCTGCFECDGAFFKGEDVAIVGGGR